MIPFGVSSTVRNVASGGNDTNTVLLIHFDGTNGSSTFIDSSQYNRTLNSFYGTPRISTEQKVFGTASGKFDGTGDSIYIVSSNSSVLNPRTKPVTIDFWIYRTEANTTCYPFSATNTGNSRMFSYNINGGIQRFVTGEANSITVPTDIPINQWMHIAIVKVGTTATLYNNGVSIGTGSIAADLFLNGSFYIGADSTSTGTKRGLVGYMDEFRYSQVARWTSDFTPPAAPYS